MSKIILFLVLVFVASVFGKMVKVPGGRSLPEECVHKVPTGSVVKKTGGRLFVTHPTIGTILIPKCAAQAKSADFPSDYDGWLAYTSFVLPNTTGASFNSFLGSFSVPNEPMSDPDILFIFTGLQNVDWVPKVDKPYPTFDIIQPVLQYPADDGFGWSVKSWYVTLNDGALQTDEVKCNPGDVIYGNMTVINDHGDWFIGGTVERNGKTAALTVQRPRLLTQPWAYTTIECYGCTDCNSLPTNECKFTGMTLTDQNNNNVVPKWTAFTTPHPKCHTRASFVTPEVVTYTFQK